MNQKSLSNKILHTMVNVPKWRETHSCHYPEDAYILRKGASHISIRHDGRMHTVQSICFTPDSQLVLVVSERVGMHPDQHHLYAFTADPILSCRESIRYVWQMADDENTAEAAVPLIPLTEDMVHIIMPLA